MKCVYCNSSGYGKVCIFSPVKVHVHLDEPNKCIYCGSINSGLGCLHNPYGKMHVKGGPIFATIQENMKKTLILSYILEKTEEKNFKSYKSPLDRFYKRVCEYFKKAAEPFLESYAITDKPIVEEFAKNYQELEEITNLKKRITEQVSDLRKSIKHASLSLSPEVVENILIDTIMKSGETR